MCQRVILLFCGIYRQTWPQMTRFKETFSPMKIRHSTIRRPLFLCALCLGIAQPVAAIPYLLKIHTLTTITTPPATGQSENDGSTASKEEVLIRDLDHNPDIDAEDVRTLTALVTTHFGQNRDFQTVSGDDIREMMELEVDKQEVGCVSGEACLEEIAGAMGARFVVHGRISRLGSEYILHLILFDAQAGRPVARDMQQSQTLAGFASKIPIAAAKLSNAIRTQLREEEKLAAQLREKEKLAAAQKARSAKKKTGATQEETDLNLESQEPSAEESEGMGVMAFLPWGVVGIGGLTSLGGIMGSVGSVAGANWYVEYWEPLEDVENNRGNVEVAMYVGLAGGLAISLVGLGAGVGGAGWALMSGGE
jgi:hypothetical protein